LGCEEGCVQPEDGQLAEDGAEQPSNAGYHDELVALRVSTTSLIS
jgi:hypothetical protein